MLTIGALFWKHLLIKCTETGGEQRKTERADPPLPPMVTHSRKN